LGKTYLTTIDLTVIQTKSAMNLSRDQKDYLRINGTVDLQEQRQKNNGTEKTTVTIGWPSLKNWHCWS